MSTYTRYAVYYLPPEGSELATFGAAWLGWDNATGQIVDHPVLDGIDVSAITETPRKYGFHGTLKPPFRLAEGTHADDLADAVATLAADITPFETPPLILKTLGFFLALVPSGRCVPLADMAMRCVTKLDHFRTAATEAELAKRRTADLSARQEAYLTEWGYPYVLDEFRFHLTLSGRLDAEGLATACQVLTPLTQRLCQDPMPVEDLALLGEIDGGRFHLIHRIPLTG